MLPQTCQPPPVLPLVPLFVSKDKLSALSLSKLCHYVNTWGFRLGLRRPQGEVGRKDELLAPSQVPADSLLLPQVFGPSLWLPQPAFQETLRPVPALGTQPTALAQGLGGRRLGFWDESMILAPNSQPSLRDRRLLWGCKYPSLQRPMRLRHRPGLSSLGFPCKHSVCTYVTYFLGLLLPGHPFVQSINIY